MQKKKILIIARDFVPYYYSLGGVLRVLKMADFFNDQGLEVFILAAKGEEISHFGYEKAVKNFHVRYVPDPLQYYITRTHKQKWTKHHHCTIPDNHIRQKINNIIRECSVPDLGIYFVQKYVKEAIRIIERHHIKNVVVSSPPHSTQIIGLKLKRVFHDRINLIVDYRDSWNTTRIFQKKHSILNVVSESLERKVLIAADHFIYCSPPILSKINRTFFDITNKSLLVMNGFDSTTEKPSQCIHTRNDYLTLGHFGAINEKSNSFRNPALLFAALAKLRKKLKIVFYGAAHISKFWQNTLKGMIEVRGSVPHEYALELMLKMDVLMLLHSEKEGADEVITGKLFEYILMGKPILVVGPENMEATRIVKNNGLGYSINLYDQEDILDNINRMHSDWENGTLPRYKLEDHKEFDRHYQYSKILKILR